MPTAIQEIVDQVKRLSVLELVELTKELETTFGVVAAAPMPAMVGTTPTPPPAVEEEKTSFSVVLSDLGANKIQVIKVVRALTSLGLKEAKDLVDKGSGTVIKDGLTKDEATKYKTELEGAGAKINLV